MIYNKLLELLFSNKNFPHYAAERRIDIFINFFLEDILSAYYEDEVVFVAAEFPLRHGANYQTIKLDYLCAFSKSSQPIFVELKSDPYSVKADQIMRYCAQARNWPECIDNLKQIIINGAMKSNYRVKYFYLIKRLLDANLIFITNEKIHEKFKHCEQLYKNPQNLKDKKNMIAFNRDFKNIIMNIGVSNKDKAELLYIGPNDKIIRDEIDMARNNCSVNLKLLDFFRISKLNMPPDMPYREEFEHLAKRLKDD